MNEIADALWGYTELGLKEYRSSALLSEELRWYRFSVKNGLVDMPSAFEAALGEGKPVIGFIVEYEALPGLSNHAVPYHCPIHEGRPGHGRGHNLFGAASVARAIAVKNVMKKHRTTGTVKLFETPAEEKCTGKPFMARDGYFKDIDAFLDLHPDVITTKDFCTCRP